MAIQEKQTDIHFGLIPDNELHRVLNEFGVTEWSLLPIVKKGTSIFDLNRSTYTARKTVLKNREKILFLKEIPWYCSTQEFVEFITTFQDSLNTKFPITPQYMSSVKNGKLYVKVGEKFYTLQNYIEGDVWDSDIIKTKECGRILGLFHKYSSKVVIQKTWPHENVFSLADSMLDLLIIKEPKLVNEVKMLKQEVNALKNSAMTKGYKDLKSTIHGDYNPMNIIFSKDLTYITDLDNACIDNPVHDVAEGIIHFSYINYKKNSTVYNSLPTKIRLEYMRAFIDGYICSNASMFNLVSSYLTECMLVTIIELLALGIICKDYSAEDFDTLVESFNVAKHQLYE